MSGSPCSIFENIFLANGIDANTNRLEKLELKGASIPEHIIISEEEYETLSPEFGKFYFTYED